MRFLTFSLSLFALAALAGCSDSAPKGPEVHVVAAGEKAAIGHLSYNIVDSQILPQLGDDANPRIPHDRFVLIQIAVTNSSNVDNPIPAVELVGDHGKTYSEITDGTGVPDWLGIVREVGPGQTVRGDVGFDAPAAHYEVRFSDESTNNQILADLPLSYAHEKLDDVIAPTADLPDVTAPSGSQKFTKPAK